jgi:hypothetical protein
MPFDDLAKVLRRVVRVYINPALIVQEQNFLEPVRNTVV